MLFLNPNFFLTVNVNFFLDVKRKKKSAISLKKKVLYNDWSGNMKEIHISALILQEIPLDSGSSETCRWFCS